jgi:hypothetical protein
LGCSSTLFRGLAPSCRWGCGRFRLIIILNLTNNTLNISLLPTKSWSFFELFDDLEDVSHFL